MDLIGGYLLIILLLFSANITLLVGNYKINTKKLILISFIGFIVSFVLMNISPYLKSRFLFSLDYFSYIFLVLAILLFCVMLYYRKDSKNNLKKSIYILIGLVVISVVLLSSQADLTLFYTLIYSLSVFITIFIVYKLTNLLVHAKREYPIIIGEYMSLASILIFIFALTYFSTKDLNYSMFSSFLILTPTYQLIYVIIGLAIVVVIGLLYNDFRGGNL
ncbi:MAG: peptide ABC transporter permease [Methanobrevibacter sp.]|uniref:peptide ABC transporter permease n=1 Tax=Methanobrevibacter sp. TaxID=66852 RepID=UPI0025FF6A83|nr:peptide ABC transporter permease [Methanobrevibacter sp.]MBQ6100404.1 peptide ABC transporter permease [Methanobrevibacter sp.]